jgi:hypothetical protein
MDARSTALTGVLRRRALRLRRGDCLSDVGRAIRFMRGMMSDRGRAGYAND